MTVKGVTLAEKLRLAREAGVTLPHYTNTDNPIDFPRSENTMNKRLRQFEKDSKLEIFGLGARRIPWEAALEKYAELIVQECIDYCGENLSKTVGSALKIHFGVEE